MKGIKRGIYFCWQKKYIVYSSGVSCCSYCCCVLLPVTELCCVGGNVRLWIGSVRKSVCYSDFSYSLGLALMLSPQNVHFWDLAGNFRHLFLPRSILLHKCTPGSLFVCLFVCERGILQRGIFKLKWTTLTLSNHRAGSGLWRKWKLLDAIPREALNISLLFSLHHTAKILRWCHWKTLLKMCFHPEKSKGKSSICSFFAGSCCWHSELEGLKWLQVPELECWPCWAGFSGSHGISPAEFSSGELSGDLQLHERCFTVGTMHKKEGDSPHCPLGFLPWRVFRHNKKELVLNPVSSAGTSR